MTHEIPILPLSEPERLWLAEIYKRNLCGQRFQARDIWPVLHEIIPRTFRPAAMDPRLISTSGENIRLHGIIALQRSYDIIPKVDKVVRWIGEQMLIAPATNVIPTEGIARGTSLPQQDVHLVLQVIQDFGRFLRSTRTAAADLFITAIELGSGDDVYYQYFDYTGIEPLILAKSYDHRIPPSEPFTMEEIKIANAKVDKILEAILADIQSLKAGQEIIWTDVKKDIEELKLLYSLGKKNWRQLLIGKVAEMIASGVVSDTLSKAVEDLFKPGVAISLPW